MKTLYKFTYKAINSSKETIMLHFFISHHDIKEAQEIVYNNLLAKIREKYNNPLKPETNIDSNDCNLMNIEILANDDRLNTSQNYLI